uniref:AlNc14C63G4555 protein n=1 Tax=Albugo laibachii Nc14 TaxID=890382 RepID=F0WD34_9STRA|nr:AlNc14C63G4555 [Albugo laibachii Nc14]|eukprot:CCA19106.1 AlNc14C63G4555 [Albugo laibachii Nc14]
MLNDTETSLVGVTIFGIATATIWFTALSMLRKYICTLLSEVPRFNPFRYNSVFLAELPWFGCKDNNTGCFTKVNVTFRFGLMSNFFLMSFE